MSDFADGDIPHNHDATPGDDGRAARGRPPRAHQFRPGTSGNPRGRPKGSKNIATLIERELDRSIVATVGGRQIKVAKREAIIMRLVDKALKGDQKAIETIFKYGDDASSQSNLPPMDTNPAQEAEILREYLRRMDDGIGGHA